MKRYFFLFMFLACSGPSLIAQDSARLKKISFRILVTDFDGKETKGWLSGINDSAIAVSKQPKHFLNTPEAVNNNLLEINYNLIAAIKLKRKTAAGRGTAIGAVCGLIAGVAAGFIAGDDPHTPASQDVFGIREAFRMTAAEKAGLLGFSGGVIGAGVGALIGALSKKTFIIGGKKQQFDEMRLNVLDRAYRSN